MSSLVEISKYIEDILRLDTTTPVKGYDGTDIGPSNEQAQALANRTKWLKEQIELLNTTLSEFKGKGYVESVNGASDIVVLSYKDVSAAKDIHEHTTSQVDPTPSRQYVSADEKSTWDNKQDKLENKVNIASVNGYNLLNGGEITIDVDGDWNRINVTENEKKSWNNKQNALVDGKTIKTVNNHSLLGNGNVALTYKDVGADAADAADNAITTHESKDNPHSQYLTQKSAETHFVLTNQANTKGGWLQLDDTGKIPADLMDTTLFYIAVKNEEERLALSPSSKTIMCLQGDNNTIYYLNPNENPSSKDNWITGRSTTGDAVTKVFGRIGDVVAKKDDYNTDQITETTERVFVHPNDKTNWDGKQKQLENEINIKSINGESILGAGKITITPESINALPSDYTFTSADVYLVNGDAFVTDVEKSTWNNKQDKLVDGKNIGKINGKGLIAGNVTLSYGDVGAAAEIHTHTADQITPTDKKQFVSSTEKQTWNNKQDKLSEDNFKTINKEVLIGEGDIVITPKSIKAADSIHTHTVDEINPGKLDRQFVTQSQITAWTNKQDHLTSGKNISTVFGQNLLTGKDINLADSTDFASTLNTNLVAGDGIGISLDDTNSKVTISRVTGSQDYTVTEVKEAKAHYSYTYPINRISVNSDAKVFKKGSFYDTEYIVDYTDITIPFKKFYPANADSNGQFPVGPMLTYGLSAATGGVVKYNTVAFTPDPNTTAIAISNGNSGKVGLVPELRSDTGGENYKTIYDSTTWAFYAWKSFKAEFPSTKTDNIGNEDNWSSNTLWEEKQGDIFLGITNTDYITLNAYGMQTFIGWYYDKTLSTEITAWRLQGRNSDTDTWVTLDTRTNQVLRSTKYEWVTYKLDKEYKYKQLRILIDDVAIKSGARPCITRLQFYTDPGILIKDKNGLYYTVNESGILAKVDVNNTTQFNQFKFKQTTTLLGTYQLEGKYPITFCANTAGAVNVGSYKRVNAVAIHFPLTQRRDWTDLSSMNILSQFDDLSANEIKILVTIDGTNCYTFKDNSWKNIGVIGLDETSAKLVMDNGMLSAALNGITTDQWKLLIGNNVGAPVGIVYARAVVNTGLSIIPKTMKVTFKSGQESWCLGGADVVFTDNGITFTPSSAGDYKFCYRIG